MRNTDLITVTEVYPGSPEAHVVHVKMPEVLVIVKFGSSLFGFRGSKIYTYKGKDPLPFEKRVIVIQFVILSCDGLN